jgi:hypothetical protein
MKNLVCTMGFVFKPKGSCHKLLLKMGFKRRLSESAKRMISRKIKRLIHAGRIPPPPIPKKRNKPKPRVRIVCGYNRIGKRGPAYPPVFKAQVMGNSILMGIGEMSREYGICKMVASRWKREMWRIIRKSGFTGISIPGFKFKRPIWNFEKKRVRHILIKAVNKNHVTP